MKEVLNDLQAKRVILLFVASLSIAFALHAYNMFHYPYFSDEGTYLSQAYSVKENNELSLYVYWYDHPPFGWITIATWVDILNDDWNFFGSSLQYRKGAHVDSSLYAGKSCLLHHVPSDEHAMACIPCDTHFFSVTTRNILSASRTPRQPPHHLGLAFCCTPPP